MIKELIFKSNFLQPGTYPRLGESVTDIVYHLKDSTFGRNHGVDEGGYCIHFADGTYHVVPKDVVAVVIYGKVLK